ncbi:hypothetical protein AX16_001982 [Volvariella volvacea WC 439]|nr:hypothetical protein AX16_001982 [Volvariella volvacea WC 439]
MSDSTRFHSEAKRFRPPNINLTLVDDKRAPIPIEVETSESSVDLSDDDAFEETLQLSSPDSDSPSSSPILPKLNLQSPDDAVPDDISKDLAALDQLRRSVKNNLRLRPIRSRGKLPKVNIVDGFPTAPFPPALANNSIWRDAPEPPPSATSTTTAYYTPIAETPLSASYSEPLASALSSPSTPLSSFQPQPPVLSPKAVQSHPARPIDPGTLYQRLTSARRPLLIDARSPASHLSFHIRHSVNIAIPFLILKRCRKPGNGFPSLDALRQFITTDQGKAIWDDLLQPSGPWDGDVVVYDDEMDTKDKDNIGSTAWALIPVLAPLLDGSDVDFLEGGISAAGHHPQLEGLIITPGDEDDTDTRIRVPPPQIIPPPLQTPGKKGRGLFQLDTQSAARSKILPEIEPMSLSPLNGPTPSPVSPMPMMPAAMPPSRVNGTQTIAYSHKQDLMDQSPSPPPSQVGFRRPPPPRTSVPNLRKSEQPTVERLNANLPKLHVRSLPKKSHTLNVPANRHHPPALTLQPPTSPSHLTLVHSNHSPPASARWAISSNSSSNNSSPNAQTADFFLSHYTPPHTPGTPRPSATYMPPSPITARPDLDAPPSTEESLPAFTISTILPNFLYLGPELTLPEHVAELKSLGVKRILNIAAECDDDHGLGLREQFERYVKIPMRDTVEEDGIGRGVREVCEILDDARLHSTPTYVHCKAGKSRSVTAVMAYLIHANHWTLSRAYQFVLDRRKGISPNIGFVSELMTFEEEELGGKSVGVQPTGAGHDQDGDHGHGHHPNYGVVAGGRRNAHVRESLPPALGGGSEGISGPLSAGGIMDVKETLGQEVEVKDAHGRYRHARRAPVDENTLQPMRRVSKAGLESSQFT